MSLTRSKGDIIFFVAIFLFSPLVMYLAILLRCHIVLLRFKSVLSIGFNKIRKEEPRNPFGYKLRIPRGSHSALIQPSDTTFILPGPPITLTRPFFGFYYIIHGTASQSNQYPFQIVRKFKHEGREPAKYWPLENHTRSISRKIAFL